MLKLVTFAPAGAPPRLGLLRDGAVAPLDTALDMTAALALPEAELRALAAAAGPELPRDAVRILPPVLHPPKIFCVGKNSRVHREELVKQDMLREDPQEPTGFVKLHATMVGEDAAVERPEGITTLDYEPELAFVIARRAHRVGHADALSHVGGITILNDLTAREIQKQEVISGTRFWTAKNMPGFCPVGPAVVPIWEVPDPYDLWLTCDVNGERRLRVSTAEHIFRIADIIAHFSRWMPLEAGDVIATGAPRGTAISHPNAAELYLRPGDTCVAGIEGLLQLTTRIVAPGVN
ncbi:fumarylacetoacetate hydrolase family protein [Roseomonas sp. BN140053]|uniref:fumarylacetoacetate hydrolase family protein n=1 Tax=Roseomonas sp. BN140053 TaxID=3391898 RepID=UPI0039E73131